MKVVSVIIVQLWSDSFFLWEVYLHMLSGNIDINILHIIKLWLQNALFVGCDKILFPMSFYLRTVSLKHSLSRLEYFMIGDTILKLVLSYLLQFRWVFFFWKFNMQMVTTRFVLRQDIKTRMGPLECRIVITKSILWQETSKSIFSTEYCINSMKILNIKKFDIYNTKDQMVDYKKNDKYYINGTYV